MTGRTPVGGARGPPEGPVAPANSGDQRTDQWSTKQSLTGVEMNKAVQAVQALQVVGAVRETVRVRVVRAVLGRVRAARRDAGMVTSEYAVGIIAAVAFAAVLYKVVTSGQVQAELQQIVGRALNGGA